MENIAQISENIPIKANIYYVKNERMGGFVPSWDEPKTKQPRKFDDILLSFSPVDKPDTINNLNKKEAFGFLDIIDIVNPLQHIPLVSMAYRAITGDQIKPSSQIIGGALFGGPAGAATGIVSAIIKEETGKDIIDNVKSFAKNDANNIYQRTKIAQGRTAGTIATYA